MEIILYFSTHGLPEVGTHPLTILWTVSPIWFSGSDRLSVISIHRWSLPIHAPTNCMKPCRSIRNITKINAVKCSLPASSFWLLAVCKNVGRRPLSLTTWSATHMTLTGSRHKDIYLIIYISSHREARIFTDCKWSKTGGRKGLGRRLVNCTTDKTGSTTLCLCYVSGESSPSIFESEHNITSDSI